MSTEYAFSDNAACAGQVARDPAFRAIAASDDEKMSLSMGPSHPSTHGVLRLQLELDGEYVTKCDPVIGYLHRGDEKIAENMTYNQFVPYTDRLDYLSPLANNVAYAIAVERLAGLEVPPRCQAIRVIVTELARISSHLLGFGSFAMDTGAWTAFLYQFTEREKLYKLFEELTGARFTTSYTRIGGAARDVPEGWIQRVGAFCDQFLPLLEEMLGLLTRNKIFLDRTVGVGVIPREDALAYGLTGPNLRGSGVSFDIRKDKPYSGYEHYEFDIPVGTTGDSYDRYLCRGEEMRQSVRIVKQVIKNFPGGAWRAGDAGDAGGAASAADVRRICAPRKEKVLTSMEELINNFMIVTEGPQMPPGEVYFEAENPKGALGFYIVSKGGGVPWRMKIRSPSFCTLSIMPRIGTGCLFTDLTAILGSLDFVMGEADR
ncbi:MAG: NADH dehydrogenase (quinone) subunit D [Opitutaceae bacterium]|jgi:NADH-quinone oxidoreductase subunit D|nr:NADH dehydrogenase (quinone) subunit D [Opitutaceae bacterium]